jgi:hypothetical protein
MGAIIKAALKAVHDNVTSTLDKFSADKTGKADFALESAGQIHHHGFYPFYAVDYCFMKVVVFFILVVLQHMTVATHM